MLKVKDNTTHLLRIVAGMGLGAGLVLGAVSEALGVGAVTCALGVLLVATNVVLALVLALREGEP